MSLVVSKHINCQFLKTRNYTREIIKLTLFVSVKPNYYFSGGDSAIAE